MSAIESASAVAAFGLINAAAVAGGAWFGAADRMSWRRSPAVPVGSH